MLSYLVLGGLSNRGSSSGASTMLSADCMTAIRYSRETGRCCHVPSSRGRSLPDMLSIVSMLGSYGEPGDEMLLLQAGDLMVVEAQLSCATTLSSQV